MFNNDLFSDAKFSFTVQFSCHVCMDLKLAFLIPIRDHIRKVKVVWSLRKLDLTLGYVRATMEQVLNVANFQRSVVPCTCYANLFVDYVEHQFFNQYNGLNLNSTVTTLTTVSAPKCQTTRRPIPRTPSRRRERRQKRI